MKDPKREQIFMFIMSNYVLKSNVLTEVIVLFISLFSSIQTNLLCMQYRYLSGRCVDRDTDTAENLKQTNILMGVLWITTVERLDFYRRRMVVAGYIIYKAQDSV